MFLLIYYNIARSLIINQCFLYCVYNSFIYLSQLLHLYCGYKNENINLKFKREIEKGFSSVQCAVTTTCASRTQRFCIFFRPCLESSSAEKSVTHLSSNNSNDKNNNYNLQLIFSATVLIPSSTDHLLLFSVYLWLWPVLGAHLAVEGMEYSALPFQFCHHCFHRPLLSPAFLAPILKPELKMSDWLNEYILYILHMRYAIESV